MCGGGGGARAGSCTGGGRGVHPSVNMEGSTQSMSRALGGAVQVRLPVLSRQNVQLQRCPTHLETQKHHLPFNRSRPEISLLTAQRSHSASLSRKRRVRHKALLSVLPLCRAAAFALWCHHVFTRISVFESFVVTFIFVVFLLSLKLTVKTDELCSAKSWRCSVTRRFSVLLMAGQQTTPH